jgi:hypothetical protein
MAGEIDEAAWSAVVGEEQVRYTELVKDGSPTFTIENDGSTLTRTVLVLWSDLDSAKNAFLGYPVIQNSDSGQQWISRHVPHAAGIFLDSANQPYLYATRLSGRGYGMPSDASEGIHDAATDFPIYRYAKLEVGYETLTYDVLSDQEMLDNGFVDANGNADEATLQRYITFEPNPGAEYLTLPVGGFKFVGPLTGGMPTPVAGGPGKIAPNYDLSITWHLVPFDAVGSLLFNPSLQNPSIDQCLGNVNSKPFPSFVTNTVSQLLQYALVATGGANYNVGDLLTIAAGDTPATVRVTAVSGGGLTGPVTLVSPAGRGSYSAIPHNPVAVTGGSGNGCTLNCSFGVGFPIGSLLMTGASIKPVRSTFGDRLYTLTYRFKFLQSGIQFLYYQGTQPNSYRDAGYFEVTNTGVTNIGTFNNVPSTEQPVNIYPWADFNTLFRVPS